jgi:deazaflavin-dependent oxidoreductase (nitroreductase family)
MSERSPRRDIRDMNAEVIAKYRAEDKDPLEPVTVVLLTTTGRKSGNPHTTPVAFQEDGDRIIVAGSMGGLPKHPQWYLNLQANPELIVEHGSERFRAKATTVPDGPERERLFARMNEVIPDLHLYAEKAAGKRTIPIIVLDRTD